MHWKLKQLLQKKGINEIENLKGTEKADFDRWQKIFSEGEFTLDKLKIYLKTQVTLIEQQWKNLDNSSEKNNRLVLLHSVYSSILQAMDAPQLEKENLEKYLDNLLK